ncbi:hypothetical protein ACEPAH_2068 [Sanghuangporus vaninii]
MKMDKSATDRASPPSSHATSGGTLATLPQHASHDDRLHFLHEQSPRELVRAISSEYSATVPSKDIEQQRSIIDSSSYSSRSSSSSPVFQLQNSSFSLASQYGLSENFRNMNIEPPIVPPEQALVKPRNRARELSAPLPSVPPSTPASAVSHRSSFSQTQSHNPSVSPSFLRHGSPIFSSPLTELSDSEEVEQDTAELSDSNSVEIISGYVAHPFVPGRYKNVGNDSQEVSRSSRTSCSVALSPSSVSPKSNGKASFMTQSTADLRSMQASVSTSQAPTPHPLSQSSSPTNIPDRKAGSNTGVSAISFIPFGSKPATPSRAQPRPGAKSESRLSSEASSPVGVPDPADGELNDESQSLAEINSAQDSSDVLRTPNVYINGLPPHFPDESLYLMTRDFGNVLSVRTFTRCVGEKMSGYGFVLFDSVDSADRCIETLRKYRNLHPSFSKQIHKIPGTPYASGTITLPPSSSLPSLTSQSTLSTMASFPSMSSTLVTSGTTSSLKSLSPPFKKFNHRTGESVSTASGSDFSGRDFKDMTFREKMERLKDEKSTNLYMEGLPLTIEDVSLAALVSPHKVISSRFFQTKLSNPPRMIAFVRLETRAGAEEIVERLHGRVVRGWNDNGCRISVRFADTHEQRELRRTERLNRGEDEMVNGAQLSMAHAALLNLRGAEVQAQLGNVNLLQQPHLAHYDHRPPVTISSSHLGNAGLPASGLTSSDPCFRLTSSQDVHHGYGNHPPMHHATQQYRHTSTLPHYPNTLSSDSSRASVNLLDAHTGVTERTAMMKRHALANMNQPSNGFSAGSLDAEQLALIQQQNQLQQLQLLRQMQKAGIDPNYAIESLDQTYSLMPSVDIATNYFIDSGTHTSVDNLPAREGTHGRKNSTSNAHHHTAQVYEKNSVSELPISTQMLSPNAEHFHGQHSASDQISVHQLQQQKQQARGQCPTSSEFGYSSQFMHRGADVREGMINNMSRRNGALEESELTLISPALTYASRTPSTLSPATPLFNTFGTPAAAPATVPRGKMNVREREYARLYKNDFRQ